MRTRIPTSHCCGPSLIQQGAPFRLPSWYMHPFSATLLVAGLSCAAMGPRASVRTLDGRRWRTLFVCLAILAVIMALWPALIFAAVYGPGIGMVRLVARLPIPANTVLCLTLLAVILVDLRVPRDWLHWLGTVVVGGGRPSSFCGAFARRFSGFDVTGPASDRF